MAQNKISAYHGTSAKAAVRIRNEKYFRESKQDNEWLGQGVYFFYYKQHAEAWIRKRNLRPGEVLIVRLEYDDKELLDLDNPAQLNELNQELEHLDEIINDKIRVDFSGRDGLQKQWCLSCNLYRKLHPEIGIISYTFSQKFSGVSQFRSNERQLCVSKPKIITEIT